MGINGDELFPPSARVFYEKAPLIEVIAQLRYPPILAIQGKPPADFQENIRQTFPLVQEESGIGLPPGMALPEQVRQMMGHQIGAAYKFLTEDGTESVTLTRDFLAYSTKKYTNWENFRKRLLNPLRALVKVYNPSFYTRIGLRYIDAINREYLGIPETKWSDLFIPQILGELAIPLFEYNVDEAMTRVQIKIPNYDGFVQFHHGLARIAEWTGISYMIDFDFYRSVRTEVAHAERTLDDFHDFAGRAFRWCITERLHNALRPRPIDPSILGSASATSP